ncbi:Na+/H+ antiporter NhaA [Francisella frigiditurris]|uniref:Na(+)/H(+) antiporter NhaA n=1 Tax=Francisella frigiditurris TaxID=1542390 RepID=A0A1J0KVB4_9GAMM|nr:Na+/H+ antiporter NhaA [Francisella frigiditurris]APC97635.1 Na+/H+ antiporter NhaA [Francisella frigiditurris]
MSNSSSNKQEIIGGSLLFIAAILAMIVNNSSFADYYNILESVHASIGINELKIDKNLLQWINDGLMAIYFLYIGLEIKREISSGILSKPSNLINPAIIAMTGLVIPSLIYFLININHSDLLSGWAIPSATDIAFTLGILALLGSKISPKLKLLVVTIAIFDDIAAIIIIAVFYTSDLSILSLALGLFFIFIMIICNLFLNIKRTSIYLVLGFFAWACTIKSGVHGTLAGVATALCIPFNNDEGKSPIKLLEDGLEPWIIYFILPIFAFANAGINFSNFNLSMLLEPVTIGIILGLFIGKQIGIFSSIYILRKTSLFNIVKEFSLLQLYGIGLICGVGFTMSLFIGTLAFDDNYTLNLVKLGVLIGSILSGTIGYIVLRIASNKSN